MARPSPVQQRDDGRYGVSRPGVSVPQPGTASGGIAGRRGGAEADSLEDELGERAAVTDVGLRSKFRADVAEAAALGRMSRGDARKAFSRFDELTTGGSFSNKAPMSAAGQRSAMDRQAWWDRASKTFGHTGFGGAREPGVGVFGGEKAAPAASPAATPAASPAAAPAVAEGSWWDRSSATFGHTGTGGARQPGVGVFGGEKAAPAASPLVPSRTPGFGDSRLSAFADRMGSWENIHNYGERTFETPDTTLQNPFGVDDGTKDPLLRKAPWGDLTLAGRLSGGR